MKFLKNHKASDTAASLNLKYTALLATKTTLTVNSAPSSELCELHQLQLQVINAGRTAGSCRRLLAGRGCIDEANLKGPPE